MLEPTQIELEQSIEELTIYRDRLRAEVINVAQKLRMPPKKVDSTLKEHPELKKIEKVLYQLKSQQLQGKSRNKAT